MRKNQDISVCKNCDLPLIFTFCWDGQEYYCLNCGKTLPFMYQKEIPITKELKLARKVLDDIWSAIYKHLIPESRGYTKTNCKKCQNHKDKYHYQHLSESEKIRDKYATMILKKLAEGFYKESKGE